MSDERVFRPRRSSLFANFFSHDPKKKVHGKDEEEETKTKRKKSDGGKRRSLVDSDDADIITYQQRYSRRSQSVCAPMAIPAVSHAKLQNYEQARRRGSDIEDQILKAKHEARTVSVIEGNLYIDYRYVGPMPIGCRV